MSYDLLFQQALSAHQNGHLDEAEKIYRQILDTAPNHPDTLNLLGLIAQSKGVHNEAVDLFYKAIRQAPKHAPFYFNLSISLEALNHPLEAIENLDKALKLTPNVKEFYHQKGLIYYRLGRFTEAKQSFLSAVRLDSDYEEAQSYLAVIQHQTEPETAEDKLLLLTQKYPQAPLCRLFLASIMLKKSQNSKALIYASEALQLDSSSDTAHNLLGLIYLQSENCDLAKEHFQKSLNINPDNITSLINLANINTNNYNYDIAEKLYLHAIEINPDNVDAHLNYADMLYKNNRITEALEEYRHVIIINPESSETSNNIAVILKDLQKYEEALALMFNAFYIDPHCEEYALNIAETLVLYYQQEPKLAVNAAQNWLSHAPDNVFAQHTLSALKGENIADSSAYSEKLFNIFAANYEKVLHDIDYNLPSKIKELLGNINGTIIDLGCGSGLIGQALKTPENKIIGVDLSQKMLDLASQKNVYEQLIKSNIEVYLSSHPQADLLIAADVMGYIGALENIISLFKGYKVCFSIEKASNIATYQIADNGRFKHNPQYVEQLLRNNGFSSVAQYADILRQENGANVNGVIFIAE